MGCEEKNSFPVYHNVRNFFMLWNSLHGVWGILIPHKMGCEEFFYAMKFLTFWVLRNFDSSQVFYLIKIMGIRFLNRRLGKNQIPNPREGKKFLILGKEKKILTLGLRPWVRNFFPSLGWGIFNLPLGEEFDSSPTACWGISNSIYLKFLL